MDLDDDGYPVGEYGQECFGRVITIGESGLNGHKIDDNDHRQQPV